MALFIKKVLINTRVETILIPDIEEILEETPEGPVFNMPSFPKRTQVKDKKYSILRLYD